MDSGEIAKLLARREELLDLLHGFEKWLLFFGVCVAIGVVGESVYGFRTWWNSRKLRNVEQSIDKYRETEIARLNKEAAELQKAGIPRTLDVPTFATKLRPFAGIGVELQSLAEFEPARTMALIMEAMKKAEWRIGMQGMWSGVPTDTLSRPGVAIEVDPDASTKESEAANVLADALTAGSITAKVHHLVRPRSPNPDIRLHVFVSLRPFPGMPDDLRVIGHDR